MKLQGILSSKGRRVVWQRNNQPPPAPEPVQEGAHKPQPGPDGALHCCGELYSPAAHVLHLKGERLATSCGEVLVADLTDPWISERDRILKAARNETTDDEAARIRLEQINLYYQEQARPRREPRQADGATDWMAE